MFDPKQHKSSVAFVGNAADAFDVARTALLALGFEIVVVSDTELEAEGPGMHSNQQPALLGVSRLRINISSSKITATASLGGVAKMKSFVYLFPPGLVLLLFFIGSRYSTEISWLYILLILPWVVISPLIGGALERKTKKAVDRLVHGMALVKTK